VKREFVQGRLALNTPPIPVSALAYPQGYRGLTAFHKYWGKKPLECLGFLIEKLTEPTDIVLDPFLGSGLLTREVIERRRRFIGIDINPISIELAKLTLSLPTSSDLHIAFANLEKCVRPKIEDSYRLRDGQVATHYLWDNCDLKAVWIAGRNGRKRIELSPTEEMMQQALRYSSYRIRFLREIQLYQNSRINATPQLKLGDLFSGRALRNIDLLIEFITSQRSHLRRALMLTLTAASGQMSKMVFVINNRGKTKGPSNSRTEVGSWVIGYWRPSTHFEINVWNCYMNRAKRLIQSESRLNSERDFKASEDVEDVYSRCVEVALINDDARKALSRIPDESIKLVLTDPPHSDRIPYLELSEMWNAFLGKRPDFSHEIVVSNARERKKDKQVYGNDMLGVLSEVFRVLVPSGYLALLFNARDDTSWSYLNDLSERLPYVNFCGCFPLAYSAGSVVQDNRVGALRNDYVLVYQKRRRADRGDHLPRSMHSIPGWTDVFPRNKM
jgi:hypothetical protein